MGSFDYTKQLRSDLLADRVTWEDVRDKIHGSAPWQKADWKKRRSVLIGVTCGKCGSTTPPLVLQHTWHPDPFAECCERIKRQLLADPKIRRRYPLPAEPAPFNPQSAPEQPTPTRNSCPKCTSVNVKQRKDGSWSCNYQFKGRRCGHVFPEPTVILYQKFEDERWLSHLESQHRWEHTKKLRAWDEKFMADYRPVILKQAALISLDQHERYVSLQAEDVVTRCKKCVFVEDKAFTFGYRAGVLRERLHQQL